MKKYKKGTLLINDEAQDALNDIMQHEHKRTQVCNETFTYFAEGQSFSVTFEYEDTVKDLCVYFERIS